jgi:hypothetical protein
MENISYRRPNIPKHESRSENNFMWRIILLLQPYNGCDYIRGIGRKTAKQSYGGHEFMENRLLDAPAKGLVTQDTDR